MKHLLNDLSFEEKNRIREQHEGGMKIDTSNFKRLIETKLGNVKPLINEDMKTSKPKVGDNLFVYKTKNDSEKFSGSVCRVEGNYLYLQSKTGSGCAEYLWDPSGLKVTKNGSTYDISDPSFNIIKQDCSRACKKTSVNEQSTDCKKLIEIPKGGIKGYEGGGEPQSDTWKEDIPKIGNPTTTYIFNGPILDAMNTQRKCHRAKNDVTYSEFVKDNGSHYTFIGID